MFTARRCPSSTSMAKLDLDGVDVVRTVFHVVKPVSDNLVNISLFRCPKNEDHCFSAAVSTFVGRRKDGRAAPTMDHGEDRVCTQATTSWTRVVALMVNIMRMCPLQSISADRGCLLDCSPATLSDIVDVDEVCWLETT